MTETMRMDPGKIKIDVDLRLGTTPKVETSSEKAERFNRWFRSFNKTVLKGYEGVIIDCACPKYLVVNNNPTSLSIKIFGQKHEMKLEDLKGIDPKKTSPQAPIFDTGMRLEENVIKGLRMDPKIKKAMDSAVLDGVKLPQFLYPPALIKAYPDNFLPEINEIPIPHKIKTERPYKEEK